MRAKAFDILEAFIKFFLTQQNAKDAITARALRIA